jgi:DNA-binding transcriptional MerR regulator
MKIGELAQVAQCTVETVRYYEKKGLFPPGTDERPTTAAMASAHVDRLRFIRNCRALDMTHMRKSTCCWV